MNFNPIKRKLNLLFNSQMRNIFTYTWVLASAFLFILAKLKKNVFQAYVKQPGANSFRSTDKRAAQGRGCFWFHRHFIEPQINKASVKSGNRIPYRTQNLGNAITRHSKAGGNRPYSRWRKKASPVQKINNTSKLSSNTVLLAKSVK